MRRNFEHKTGVLREPFDVSFIAGVNKDRSIRGCAAPEGVVYEISLLECLVALGVEVEMVKRLSEVACSIELIVLCR